MQTTESRTYGNTNWIDQLTNITELAVTNDVSIDIAIDHGAVKYSVSDDSVKVVVESN